jgi:LDH2 family malate/lactate/ureidoglycolate dehydrogenase
MYVITFIYIIYVIRKLLFMEFFMRYSVEALTDYCKNVLESAGLNSNDAEVAARSLIEADMRGVSSHGVTRLRTYAKRIRTGVIRSNVAPKIEQEKAAALLMNGNNGMGSVIGRKVMQECMDRADTYGSCFAAVNNCNHFGIGAFFTQPVAQKGYIAIAMSNATASVVPFGGAEPMIGTNPLSIAIPTGTEMPIVMDMATSVVAQGKIIQAKKEGKTIPKGWAVDPDGNDTTDTEQALAGAMLPFGGPKGYAIGLLIQILCSVLSGANTDKNIPSFWNNFQDPQNLGNFFGVLRIDAFQAPELFYSNMKLLIESIKNSRPSPGITSVMLPGEIEFNAQIKAEEEGVELTEAIYQDILSLADEYHVDAGVLHQQ